MEWIRINQDGSGKDPCCFSRVRPGSFLDGRIRVRVKFPSGSLDPYLSQGPLGAKRQIWIQNLELRLIVINYLYFFLLNIFWTKLSCLSCSKSSSDNSASRTFHQKIFVMEIGIIKKEIVFIVYLLPRDKNSITNGWWCWFPVNYFLITHDIIIQSKIVQSVFNPSTRV